MWMPSQSLTVVAQPVSRAIVCALLQVLDGLRQKEKNIKNDRYMIFVAVGDFIKKEAWPTSCTPCSEEDLSVCSRSECLRDAQHPCPGLRACKNPGGLTLSLLRPTPQEAVQPGEDREAEPASEASGSGSSGPSTDIEAVVEVGWERGCLVYACAVLCTSLEAEGLDLEVHVSQGN